MPMSGDEWLQYFADKPKERKADWLSTVTSLLGAAGGSFGGPQGAMQGYQAGQALGNIGEDAINHTLSADNVVGNAKAAYGAGRAAMPQPPGGVGGYEDLLRQLGLSGVGMAGGGVVPGMIRRPEDLLAALMAAQGQGGMAPQTSTDASGSPPAPSPEEMLAQQDRSLGGPPVPKPMQTAQHPGWEALGLILGDVLQKLPPPRAGINGQNQTNRTIGAYLPAAGAAAEGLPKVNMARRAVANAQAEKASEQAQATWTTQARDLANRRWQLAMKDKPQATNASASSASAQMYPVSPDEAKRLGKPEWAGTSQPVGLVEQARRGMPPSEKKSGQDVVYDKKVGQAREIARRVRLGLTDPRMAGFRELKPMVEAELGDFNTAQAVQSYEATLSFVKQRESRLTQQQRNSMRAVQKQFGLLEKFNQEYSDAAGGLRTAMNKPNASVLWMAENGMLGKKAELLSRNLKGQTVLMADQIANIFMAGGVPTDQALKMAQDVLHASWSEDQLASNSNMVKSDIAGRLAALNEGTPMVDTNYLPKPAKADTAAVEKVFNW